MIGVGFDARVVDGLDLGLKRVLGKLAYVFSAVRQFLRCRPRRYQVEINGRTFPATSVVIATGHYDGGRFVVAPAARLGRLPPIALVTAER